MLRKLFMGATLALAIASIAGCSGSSSTDSTGTRTIGPEGGFLSIALGLSRATVTIPPNAVSQPTRFVLAAATSVPPAPAPDKPVLPNTAVTIQPDITFAQPITIVLPYAKTDIPQGKTDASLLMCKATVDSKWVRVRPAPTDSTVDSTAQTVTDVTTDTNGARPFAVLAIKP